jgi:hypothetical protein
MQVGRLGLPCPPTRAICFDGLQRRLPCLAAVLQRMLPLLSVKQQRLKLAGAASCRSTALETLYTDLPVSPADLETQIGRADSGRIHLHTYRGLLDQIDWSRRDCGHRDGKWSVRESYFWHDI